MWAYRREQVKGCHALNIDLPAIKYLDLLDL